MAAQVQPLATCTTRGLQRMYVFGCGNGADMPQWHRAHTCRRRSCCPRSTARSGTCAGAAPVMTRNPPLGEPRWNRSTSSATAC